MFNRAEEVCESQDSGKAAVAASVKAKYFESTS
jgi:hypothetical protein